MNWKKVKFLDAFTDITGGNQKFNTNEYLSVGEIPVIDQGKELVAGYVDDYTAFDNVPVIVFGDHTRVFKYIDFPFVLGADGVKILKPKDDINTKYAYYALQKVYIPNTGYNRHFKWLKEAEIPLHDLTTQQHIAQVLDQADALRQQNRQLLAYYDELLQSTFIDLFGDPVKNEKGWEVKKLVDIAKAERGRFSPRPRNDPSYFDGKYPFIQTGDISSSNHRVSKWQQTLNEKGIKVSKKFEKGNIVVAIVGATIGASAILEIDTYAPDSVIGIIVDKKCINNFFLEFVLRYWKPIFLAQAPATARANINLETFKPLPIPIPPLSLQQHFAKIVEEIEAHKSLVQQSLAESEALFEGLLAEYFG